jgi:hypothetical protein
MEDRVFFDRFISLLENTRDRYELDTIHDALIVWFGENHLSLDADDVKERIIEDKRAEGVDAVLIDRTNYELLFLQARTVDNFDNAQKNFPENDLKSALEGIRFLLRGDYKGQITPELENLIDEYHELDKTSDYQTRIVFLALKKRPTDDKFIESFKKDFPEIEVDFYDFGWLSDFFVNKYLTMRAAPPERISFEILTDILHKDTPNKSRIFTCKGKEIARIYNDYKERIFQQNVRYSLGVRSKSINRQILETATSDERSINFWYFNNGITIVCKNIGEPSSGKVINLDNAQIINGAQTTYALHEAYKNGTLKDNVEVLIRVIANSDRDFVENVTLYTNSQNAVRLRDLCSNDEIQSKIQSIVLGSYQYFYERKRGEIDSLYPTIEAKRKLLGDNYKLKVISNENCAQSLLAMYLDKPAQAKSEKGRIFLKDRTGFYDDIFNQSDDLVAEKMLMSWKLVKYIEKYKKEYNKRYKVAEDLPEGEKNEIYKYDFLRHGEYFILNLFKDFLKNGGFNIHSSKDDLLMIISKIDSNDNQIQGYYETIKDVLAEYIGERKKEPKYYHNKFFKNETSIGLIRSSFNKKHSFIEVI